MDLIALLGLMAGGASGCDVAPTQREGLFDEWLGEASADHGAGALLTLSQVNATILAFGLGLALVTTQLSSRHGIAKVSLPRVDTLFFILFALVGVALPLLASLKPDRGAAVALIVASVIFFIVPTPYMMWRAVRAGLPPWRIRHAVRGAEPRRLQRRGRHLARLADGQETLLGIRAAEAPGEVRDQAQAALLYLLGISCDSGDSRRAASLIEAVLGPFDDDAVWRLASFADWLQNSRDPGRLQALCGHAAAWDRAWTLIRRAAVDGPDRLAIPGLEVATVLAAGRVADCYRRASSLEANDHWGRPIAQLRVGLDGQVSAVLQKANELALDVTARSAPERQTKTLFDATCALLSEPAREIHMGDDVAFAIPLEGVRAACRLLVETLEATTPLTESQRTEATVRIRHLGAVLLRLLEAGQGCGHLDSAEGRSILVCYLEWIDDASARGDRRLMEDLIHDLKTAIRGNFVPRNQQLRTVTGRPLDHRATTASRLAVTGLLGAVASNLASTAAQYHLDHDDGSTFHEGAWLGFDVLDWRHEKDAPEVARRFLPALEDRYLSLFLEEDNGDELSDLERVLRLDTSLRPYDVLRSWLQLPMRPDARLAVLLARWRSALRHDHRRPARMDREHQEWQADMRAKARGKAKKELEDLFNRPVQPLPGKFFRPYLLSRDLLESLVTTPARETGAAADTYERWRAAASMWLDATIGDGEPDLDDLLKGNAFPATGPEGIADDIRRPHAVANAFGTEIRHGTWQTVFRYNTSNDETLSGRNYDFRRADLPPRTYCLLPHWEGDDRGFVVAVDADHSTRILVLEREHGLSAEKVIPFTRPYLVDVILADCLGDLGRCRVCFGLLAGLDQLQCPECAGTGQLRYYRTLSSATWEFLDRLPASGLVPARDPEFAWLRHEAESAHRDDLGDRVRVFTSHVLREHLATTLAAEGSGAKADESPYGEEGRREPVAHDGESPDDPPPDVALTPPK